MIWRFFSSVKLTLGLLLVMAVAAVPGTVIPPEMGRYEVFYQTPWFRVLLGLLALNLLVCTIRTIGRNLHDRRRFSARLEQPATAALKLDAASIDILATRLKTLGFAADVTGNRLWATRGRVGRWGSTLVHLSVLFIMLGATLGQTGFVGTINTYLNHLNLEYFDWQSQADRPLGFGVRVDAFRLVYYPITLRFEARDPQKGTRTSITQSEGESFVFGDGRRIQIKSFDPHRKMLTLGIYQQEKYLGDYRLDDKGENFGALPNPGFTVRKIEFRDPVLKQIESDITIIEGGQIAEQATLSVNNPLVWRGVAIFQTAYGQDKEGAWTVGLQLSKDPGEGLVWVASITLVLGLLAAFTLPFRALGIRRQDNAFYLLALHGFRSESDRELLRDIAQRLNQPDAKAG